MSKSRACGSISTYLLWYNRPKRQSTFNFFCSSRVPFCNNLGHTKHLELIQHQVVSKWLDEVMQIWVCSKKFSQGHTFWIVFLAQLTCSSIEAWINSSMWSFKSSIKVACSFFFFRHDVMVGEGAVHEGCFPCWPFWFSMTSITDTKAIPHQLNDHQDCLV